MLANIYLNEYDQEMARRGVPVNRYADDIVVLEKSPRAAQQLLESIKRYLEGKLKLKMNTEKSKVVSVYSIRNFKFLGFALGKGRNGVYIRAHAKSLKKAKAKLKELTSRSQGRRIQTVMEKVNVYMGLAWLLRNCKHQDNITGMGWLAAAPVTVLCLETVEETKEAGKEPDSAGNSRVAGMGSEQLPKGLLAHGKEWPCTKGNLNRKARTARIQEYP